ncbi:M1 family metallopeptidase [Altibacter sp.]|uniref:M1 family metallopeptidase n=1 Tax=Altibacter sp. TaxID=2024823 RepID=UPI00258A6F27|nr:M1 family metallopeptidase [Altibacter sp.]MCW9037651.1 M1 family metallopeptidase [Altibacter sp.]
MKRTIFLLGFICFSIINSSAQTFNRQDSLLGSITPERSWWDLKHYKLEVTVDPNTKSLQGSNTIRYRVLKSHDVMQIDLQAPMEIDSIIYRKKSLSFTSEGNAHFIRFTKKQPKDSDEQLTIYFSGKPRVARRPPWDGGFTWQKDTNGKFFIANANQGIGASIWWPNKDHPYDEPDQGVRLSITTPKDLVGVGNGRLVGTDENDNSKTWHWNVSNPINNYGVNINIGDYVHFGETYSGLKGDLDMDYWVLRENEAKARKQFQQTVGMMEAFEHWFGPYPFYEDSFKLVEVPYLGMEHQSSVTYGNNYGNGYLGNDLSGTGWGLKFDFIIIHEAGHEWFANNITNQDVADMWLHEGFTAYSENLYLDYHYGKNAAADYVIGTRRMIQNDRPIIGTYNVRHEGSSDMYYKGANILHTLRQLLEDDERWRAILRGLNKDFYHQTVSSAMVEQYISKASGIDLTEFWEQYLRTTMIPLVEYKVDGNQLSFRYEDIIKGFDMPVIALVNEEEEWIFPTSEWKSKTFSEKIQSVEIKRDFFVNSEKLE